jgi:SCY1-like protein 1
VHGNVCADSVWITPSGEFRLGGLEYLSTPGEPALALAPTSPIHAPPEVRRDGWQAATSSSPTTSSDAWAFGVLLNELYSGRAPMRAEELAQTSNIPPQLVPQYKLLLSQNPKARLTPSRFLAETTRSQGFLDEPFCKACIFLDAIALKSASEKEEWISTVAPLIPSFPIEFCKVFPCASQVNYCSTRCFQRW